MKKLMTLLSVACLCGVLVGCAAEDDVDVSDPITPAPEAAVEPMPGTETMPDAELETPATDADPVTDEPTIPGAEDTSATEEPVDPAETEEQPAP